jgi:Rho-binding antiterminator
MNTDYTPIDCDFYDVLEALSTLRKNCEIVYVASQQSPTATTVRGRITNLYALQGEEFLVIDHTLSLRLDALVSLNGTPVPISGCASDAPFFAHLLRKSSALPMPE